MLFVKISQPTIELYNIIRFHTRNAYIGTDQGLRILQCALNTIHAPRAIQYLCDGEVNKELHRHILGSLRQRQELLIYPQGALFFALLKQQDLF